MYYVCLLLSLFVYYIIFIEKVNIKIKKISKKYFQHLIISKLDSGQAKRSIRLWRYPTPSNWRVVEHNAFGVAPSL